jgi:glycosyltransferase involved in cell wall biosynthesis
VGSAGRFDSGKRLDLVIDAFARVVASGTDAHLILIGDGEARQFLEARVKGAGLLDRVCFTGLDPEARSWMSALDVFCFASVDEGLPNAVLEAAAAGVPVVAWRTDFLREALDHAESAVLVEPGGVEGYVQALAALLADSAMRERVGRQARRVVLERFAVSRFVSGLTATYEGLLERAR